MEDDVRRLRGLLGVGTLWGFAWAVIGAVLGVAIGVLSPDVWLWSNPIIEWALGMGVYGFVSGVGFGGLLAFRESRKSLDELSPARAAVWGVLGAVLVPVLFGMLGAFELGTTSLDVLEAMGMTALLGGTFAGGSVAIAQSARRLEAGEDALLESADDTPRLRR
jgi:hypothetical protein